MKYEDARPLMKTGDLVFFTRLTLADIIKRGKWTDLFGWLSNWVIVLGQTYNSGSWDGCNDLIHVGVIVRNGNAVLLAEYTAGQRGPGLNALSRRLAYPGKVLWLPLCAQADTQPLDEWLKRHSVDDYNFLGLPAAITRLFPGWRRPGKQFCSEAAIAMLQWIGAMPKCRQVLRNQRLVEAEIEPHWFSPAEAARLCPICWESAYMLEV